jgi:hypothetical protein
MHRRIAAFAVALCCLPFAACGSPHHSPTVKTLPPSVVHACPEATGDHGSMGACAPESESAR